MDFTDFNTGKDDIGRRLDKVIKIFLPTIPLSNLYQSLRKNLIKVNGKKQKPDYKIEQADVLSIADVLLEQYSLSITSVPSCTIANVVTGNVNGLISLSSL